MELVSMATEEFYEYGYINNSSTLLVSEIHEKYTALVIQHFEY